MYVAVEFVCMGSRGFLDGREGNLQVIHLTNSMYKRLFVKKKKVKWGGKGEQISALHLGTLVRSVHSLIWKGEAIKKGKRRTVRSPEQMKGGQEYWGYRTTCINMRLEMWK